MSSSPTAPTTHRTGTVVVGGGQAGLSTSWFLTRDGVDHVVLEAATAAHEWADTRWASFTLVTPNWHCRLPGYAYDGPDPDGFMTRDEVVAWLAGYAGTFGPPLRERTRVVALTQREGGGFVVDAEGPDGAERWEADHVVVATGGYHQPIVPAWAAALDPALTQLHSAEYEQAADLPDGEVLVVGSGQSGAQIAEDLHLAGRRVHLALGDAPRVARFHRGRDVMTWLAEMGLYDTAVAQYPGGVAAREKTNHYVTGRDGGRDIDLRRFAREGMRLYGMLADGRGTRLSFRPTLTAALDAADDTYRSICRDVDAFIARDPAAAQVAGPEEPPYEPVWVPPEDPTSLDLAAAGVTTVVWAIGYRPDYRWVRVGAFDGTGRPTHVRGVSGVPGLFFLGLPWLHTWGSGRFLGIAADAEHVAGHITGRPTSETLPAAELARRTSPGPLAAVPAGR
ncbi:MSMEG_0569 family flavin-dependent oxidoreductase [Nocardioides sp. ChNu-99]|uniref:MSMEG_0569 family flavin-dependent oxidoreductase n=1 Tax=Nocardioides sp. ChNu-99 TaxID=2839897 RepID=UPI00240689D9|nr:MSMEG_0569 family flavin-dependent oxidoreductase [Nocardioides sp. ChNu-99]MDF9717656.1 MSMEG_0569 family flavin-dependent oxidoreductase [Nocardioides sp. ChNu-99]